MEARPARKEELIPGIQVGIWCYACPTLLGTVEHPAYVGAPNRVGSGKHIRLDPRYVEKPGRFYKPLHRTPRHADSRLHEEPDLPYDHAVTASIYQRHHFKAQATYVPYDHCRVECFCGVVNEVMRPT